MIKDLMVLDFETYYASDYSLSLAKYNTSEYIRDEQFFIHGCGFQHFGYKPYWIAGHDEALKECQRLDLPDRPVVAHNMAFDGFILHEWADIHCGTYCDTLSMARAAIGHAAKHNLNAVAELLKIGHKTEGLENTKGKRRLSKQEARRLGEYCKNDTWLCMKIYQILLEYIPLKEMQLIDLTLRMFCDPRLLVDTEMVEAEWLLERENKRAAVYEADTQTEILMSNPKFAEALTALGVIPPTKISQRTNKEAYAFAKTDFGFRELLCHKDEAVRFLAEARQLVKSTINETRALRLFKAGSDGQLLPVLLNYAGAHTFRWSGGNKLNLQNLPRGGALRRAVLAPLGHQLLVLDLAQIEARLIVWLVGQQDLVEAFRAYDKKTGEDVYKIMASKIYSKPLNQVTSDERAIGKAATLGLGFGMGYRKLRLTLAIGFVGPPIKISDDEARHIVNVYRAANPYIVARWNFLNEILQHMAVDETLNFTLGPVIFKYKMIVLPNGLSLKYTGLSIDEEGEASYLGRYGRTKIWGGMLLENIVQALARCVISDQMHEIAKRYFIASMSHDEIISIVRDDGINEAVIWQTEIMTRPISWAPEMPLAVDVSYDRRYSK